MTTPLNEPAHASTPTASGVVRRAVQSPSLRTAAILGAGGLGFALGTVLLARVLPEQEFGAVSLLLSLIQVGAALGSLGLPVLINRHRLAASAQLLRYALALSAAAAVLIALLTGGFYDLSATLALVLAIVVAFAGVGRVAGAVFHSQRRFGRSLLLTQIHNWLLLACVPLVVLLDARSALAVATILLCCYLATSILGWRAAARLPHLQEHALTLRVFRSEGLSAAGFTLALNIFFQLDRLVIGRVLSLEDLAAYAIVAAIAGSPYRMLQVGAGYTLAPRLRAILDRAAALRLLRREALLVFAIAALGIAPLLLLTPWLVDRVLEQRYASPYALVGAVIVVGFIRIAEGFAAAVVSAIGSPGELFRLSVLSWAGVALAIALAVMVRSQGLVSVVYALGAGWLLIALGAGLLARSALNRSWRG